MVGLGGRGVAMARKKSLLLCPRLLLLIFICTIGLNGFLKYFFEDFHYHFNFKGNQVNEAVSDVNITLDGVTYPG